MNVFKILKIYNKLITLSIFFILLLFVIAPFSGEIFYFFRSKDESSQIKYQGLLAEEYLDSVPEDLAEKPDGNTLLIPKIGVETAIFEGSEEVLDWGGWLRPSSSYPSLGGNTVIAAHRFLYTNGPNTFYHLDKLENDDKISVFWNGREFLYEVFETKVVKASQTEIEENTIDPILTLYTCTPIWTSENRLVVKARLIATEQL